MTSIGARGVTLSQIQHVLRLPANALLVRSGAMAQLMTSMTAQITNEVIMDLAKILWVPRGLALKILLSYQGNRYGLLCILPDHYNELSKLESRIVSFGYTPTTLLRKMIQRDVNVTLPKFSIQFYMEMSHIFREMGILDLFTNEADLSGMSSGSKSALLKVSSIYHQSTIEVNEGGSETTAASGQPVRPSSIYLSETDQVIYPKTPLQSDYYKFIYKQNSDRYFSNSPSAPSSHIPIVFPSEDFDENRFKRDSAINSTTSVSNVNEENPSSGSEDIGTRLKDPLWFNKPTASEVIVPINAPESNSKPELSKPVANSNDKLNKSDKTSPAGSFGVRPQFKPALEEPSTTRQPLTSTVPPSIFDSLTPSPNPTTVFPVNNLNSGWNEQNIGIAPGFPPLTNGVTDPNNRPIFISSPWYPSQFNPPFQSFSLGPSAGIFFPEYRFSSTRN